MSRWSHLLMIGWLVLALLPKGAVAANDMAAADVFFEANRAYKSDRFRQAADGYLKLIESGCENGHVYYNLGNAYFRLGDLGRAILFYERARVLIPRDDDLISNLSHARNQVQDAVGDAVTFSLHEVLGLDSLSLSETFSIFAVLNAFFFAVACTRLIRKFEWTYYLAMLLAILLGIGAFAFVLKWHGAATDDRAVVLAEEIAVRAGPDPDDTLLFKIHKGAVVQHERTEGDWVLIHLSKDKRGWTRAAQLERVTASTVFKIMP